MRRGHAQLVRKTFSEAPLVWAADGRHYIRAIESAQQAEVAAVALETPTDLAAFYLSHQDEFEGRRPQYRGFVVHDRDGSVDGAIIIERDGFCWKPVGVTWPKGRKRPTKGLKAAVQALCTQEGVCGIHPDNPSGHVNRSTLGRLNCNAVTSYSRRKRPQAVLGRAGTHKTKRPTISMRRKMPSALFALPRSAMSAASLRRLPKGVPGSYPMDTMARARNARSRAISMLNAGHLSRDEAQTIFNRTAAFSAEMVRKKVRGWNRLEPKMVAGKKRSFRSVGSGMRAAANRFTGRGNCGCTGRDNCGCSSCRR